MAEGSTQSQPAARITELFSRHRARLPAGGEVPAESAAFFSSCFLFSRLPASTGAEALREAVLPAYEDYLRTYLQLLAEEQPLTDSEALVQTKKAQLEYASYRAEKDPARGMLTRLYGADFTEKLIRQVLFDLPYTQAV